MPGGNFLDDLSHENISMIMQHRALGPQAAEAFSNVAAPPGPPCGAHDTLLSETKKIMSQSVAREFSQIVADLKTLQNDALKQEVIMLTLLRCDRDLYVDPDFVNVVASMMRKYRNTQQVQTCGCRLLCLKNQHPDARFFTAEYDVICNALNAFNSIPRLALWALHSLSLNSAAFKIAYHAPPPQGGLFGGDTTNPVNNLNNRDLKMVFASRRGGLDKILASVIRCIDAQNSPDLSEERIKIVKYGCRILADLSNAVTFARVATLCRAESSAKQSAVPGAALKDGNSSVIAGMDRCLLQVIVNTQVHRAAAFLHDFDRVITQIDIMATDILISMIKANALSDTSNIMGDIPATSVPDDVAAGAPTKAKASVNVTTTPAAAYTRRDETNDVLSLALQNVSRNRYSAGGRQKATNFPPPTTETKLAAAAIGVPKPRPPENTVRAVPATNLPVDPIGNIPRLILAGNTSKFRVLTEYCNMPGRHFLWERYASHVPPILTTLRRVRTSQEKFACIPSLEFLEGFGRNNSKHQALLIGHGAHVVLRDLLYSTPRTALPRNTMQHVLMMPNPAAEQQRINALIAQDAVIGQIHEGVFFALTNFFCSPMTRELNAQMIDCFMPEIKQPLAHWDGDAIMLDPGQDTVRMRQNLRKALYASQSSVKKVVCSLLMLRWMFFNDEVSDGKYRKYLMKDVLACCARYPDNAAVAQAAFSLFYQMGLQHQFFFNIEESVVLAVDSMKKNETNPAPMAACIRFLHAISQTQKYDIAVQQDFLQTYFLRLRKLAAPGNTPDVTRMLHEICDKLVFFDAQHQHLSGQDQPIVF